MGKAGKALRQVLSNYGISQNRLAVTMGINRSTVHQWVNEISDPLAEAVTEIIKALRTLEATAATDFIDLYLERRAQEGDIDSQAIDPTPKDEEPTVPQDSSVRLPDGEPSEPL
jgi:transcriptional regulator with XRE-family HTH domain